MKKIAVAVLLIGTLFLVGCGGNSTVSKVPSGDNCTENVAYLQEGVNQYKAALGEYPESVEQLLNTVDGKGPFVEIVPACPGGNIYVIDNGIVREAPPVQ